MANTAKHIFTGVCLVLAAGGARSAEPAFSAEKVAFFESKIRPLLSESCHECHHPAHKVKGGLRLDRRDLILKGGDSGPAAVPSDPARSLLIEAVGYHNVDLQMPPRNRLPEDRIALLTQWVQQGLPWPVEAAGEADNPVKDFDLARRRAAHWCWQPLKPATPPGAAPGTPAQPLDRLLADEHKKAGLVAARPASPETWLRRAHLVLTGLPPTVAEREAFLADVSPGARATVVDRLLASPHFGERWARHWMDLVRYSETLGHEFDFTLPNAWRYRDYVVRAFNADLPYPQFVREHIAGDLVEPPRLEPATGLNESIIGTAFYWFGQQVHSPVDIRRNQADVIDNQIDVLTKTFQGLTVSCARCHDHMFDAISTRDYYALYGVLSSSRYEQAPIADPARRHATRAEAVKAVADAAPLHTEAAAARVRRWLDALTAPQPSELLAALKDPKGPKDTALRPFRALADGKKVVLPEPGWGKSSPPDPSRTTVLLDADRALADGWSTADGTPADLLRPAGAPIGTGPLAMRTHFTELPVYHSATAGPLASASMRSGTFVIDRPRLRLFAGGDGARVQVVIENFQVIRAPIYGPLRQTLQEGVYRWINVDLSMWQGRRAYVEFVDSPVAGLSEPDLPPRDAWFAVHQVALTDDPHGLPDPRLALWAGMPRQEFTDLSGLLGALPDWLRSDTPQRAFAASAWNALARREAADPVVITAPSPEWARAIQGAADDLHVPAMTEGPGLDEAVFIRGNPHRLGEPAPRGFLEAIGGDARVVTDSSSGRMALADWILRDDNPLTRRVYVNRVWQHVFGTGIAATPDDFGVLGSPPGLPGVLDWLAGWFAREGGHSTKALLRLLVLSDTFALGGEPDAASLQRDPVNRNLHYLPTRRMEAEIIRDSALAVAGVLDPAVGGPSVPVHLTAFMDGRGKPGRNGPADGDRRRSIYIETRRNFLNPTLLSFDLPLPSTTIGRRTRSNVPAQSLALLNDPFFTAMAGAWSARVGAMHPDPAARVRQMHLEAFAREPTAEETDSCLAFVREQTDTARAAGDAQPDARAWADLAHAFFNLKEFIYVP